MNNENTHRIARIITATGRAKGFVQANGNLRVVARSCAVARIEIGNACRKAGITEESIGDVFEVRFLGTKNVLTYPIQHDPMRSGIDLRTGALINA